MNTRQFILGLGHQKCGTTWLHNYLAESPMFAEGFVKEFHIWDRKDSDLFGSPEPRKLLNFGKSSADMKQRMRASSRFYFKYFASLYGDGRSISADITPSYSVLKAERIAYIDHQFAKRGIDVKAVILVREPVSRIKSAVRYNLDRGNYSEGISRGVTDFDAALRQYYQSEHCAVRTRYQHIIEEAKKALPEERIYLGFYEQMFSDEEIARLSKFLGIEPKVDFGKVRVNKTKNTVTETEIDAEVRRYYDDVYAYFDQKYPISRELWGGQGHQ